MQVCHHLRKFSYTFDLNVYGDKQDSNLYKFAIACFLVNFK